MQTRHPLLGFFLAILILLALASPAAAHTAFESSSPDDGQTIEGPISEILLTFSGEAMPAGEGFAILDSDGVVRVPVEVISADNLTWVLRFAEPLADGEVGVRWSVAAPDTHPIEGSFSFTVTSPAAVVTTPPTTTPPGSALAQATPREEAVELDDFLNTASPTAPGGSLLANAGRILRLLGTAVAIGGLVFATFVLQRGSRDSRAVLFWVRRSGVALVIGAISSAVAQLIGAAGSWSGLWSFSSFDDVLWSSVGLAIALRFLAGALFAYGVRVTEAPSAAPRLSGIQQWHAPGSPLAFVGTALLALSFLFDGHTVSEGPRWLHAVANLVHVTAAATWAGGVMMLWFVMVRRRRRGAPNRSLELGVRFSVVATIALVAAAIAGVALSVVILDSVPEIWTTPWGKLLIAKVLLVAVAAIGGGYNHRVIVPGLKRTPYDPTLVARFRSVVTVEAMALLAVTIATAFLIAASSN